MGIGAISFTMEDLVGTLIANEAEMTILPSSNKVFSHCKLPLLG